MFERRLELIQKWGQVGDKNNFPHYLIRYTMVKRKTDFRVWNCDLGLVDELCFKGLKFGVQLLKNM